MKNKKKVSAKRQKKNIYIIIVLEGERKQNEADKVFKEMMAGNIPNLPKAINHEQI